MIHFGLDLGQRNCGLAWLKDGVLTRAGLVKNPEKKGDGPASWRAMSDAVWKWAAECDLLVTSDIKLIFERMKVYPGGRGQGNPADLISLSLLGGFIHGSFVTRCDVFCPHEWKGTIDADVCIARIKERLTPEEFAAIEFPANTCDTCREQKGMSPCQKSSCLAHNIFDAVGLALFSAGRFSKRRVIAR